MAGIMDEYDAATPVSKMYCARMSTEEYEKQASTCTEDALADLIQYLEKYPSTYKKVIGRRKREEEENAGFFSYAKVKLVSLFTGKEHGDVSEEECSREVAKVTADMVKAFDYSEESRGRRCSKRLAAKRLRDQRNKSSEDQQSRKMASLSSDLPLPAPTPPPPPPPPVPSFATPLERGTLSRRPLSARHLNQNAKSCPRPVKQHRPLKSQKPHLPMKQQRVNVLKSEIPAAAAAAASSDGGAGSDGGASSDGGAGSANTFQDMLHELNDPGKKRMLRSTMPRSPGGTPITGWPKSKQRDPNHYFNTKLVDKFKNIRSPVFSSATPPDTFDSPVSPSDSQFF